MHMHSIFCSLSCRVGVQTFLSTIKALCVSQSLPLCACGPGARQGEYSLFIKHPLASSQSEWCPYEITYSPLSFLRMSTVLKYELRGKEARLEWQTLPSGTLLTFRHRYSWPGARWRTFTRLQYCEIFKSVWARVTLCVRTSARAKTSGVKARPLLTDGVNALLHGLSADKNAGNVIQTHWFEFTFLFFLKSPITHIEDKQEWTHPHKTSSAAGPQSKSFLPWFIFKDVYVP